MLYPWQSASWNALTAQLQPNGRFAHALVIHGQAGIGKEAFARHLAQALLCEEGHGPHAMRGRPCGRCPACHWFEQGNHPDFHAVYPENLAPPLPTSTDGDVSEKGGKAAKGKATDGDVGEGDTKGKALSKEIKIEQIRALLTFCGIGAHRGGRRVVLVYPAEALNGAAANALLKTLEEPPVGVMFLMVSANLDRLLPTIISRCRQWPLAGPDRALASEWLAAQPGVPSPMAARDALAQTGGAPLAAHALFGDPHHAALLPLRDGLIQQWSAGAQCDAFACADAVQKTAVPIVLGWLQRWVYDLASVTLTGQIRYFPAHATALRRCAMQADAMVLMQFQQALLRERMTEQHPLNARLVFESLFVRYRAVFSLSPR
ncbi:DNA polymerase III subunit delta' [Robbsia andropogonis]|uniref:DNA polymerase III subunit delta' n=1 Tax=Robbsia andropogonis TaxID=28092 RepID=UPI002A69AA17|nr:DNA polymerase III subunit delta' [Robbsia andropogonis]